MKFVVCVRVGLTQGTVNKPEWRLQGCAWQRMLAVGCRACVREGCARRGWRSKVCAAERSVPRMGCGEKPVRAAGWAAQCHLWMHPRPGDCTLQSFPGPGCVWKARGASTFRLREVSAHKATRAAAKVGVQTLEGSQGSRIEGAPALPLGGGKGEEAPPWANCAPETNPGPSDGGRAEPGPQQRPNPEDLTISADGRGGPGKRPLSLRIRGCGGVSPRLERATLPRRSSSPRSRVSVGDVSRADPQGPPRIRAASQREEAPGGRPAQSPRGGPQDRGFPDCVLARVEGAARGGAKAPEGREGPRGVASRRRSQGRPVILRVGAKPRRGPGGGTRGARGL